MKNYYRMREKIATAWDNNLANRINDIHEGDDKTYLHAIVPHVINKAKSLFVPSSKILDVGSGCGYLTNEISKTHPNIMGVDISLKSIEYAKNAYKSINFNNTDIYELENSGKFDLVLATMVIHNLPCLTAFFHKAASLLDKNGSLLITTVHPAFWPDDKLNERFPYFQNGKEYTIIFRRRRHVKYSSNVSYFHRTIECYQNEMVKCGFSIKDTHELLEFGANESEDKPHIISWLLQLNQ